MATSPTPSLDSIRGTNSIESYGEHNDYLSDSPLTLSGSSPPVSDSAISDDFGSTGGTNGINSQHPALSVSSSASSASSSSRLSSSSDSGIIACNSNLVRGVCNGIISNNIVSIPNANGSTVPQCTACKSKESDAVAKCFECVNFLCSNCATAHEYMHCFNGHNVSMISSFENASLSTLNSNPLPNLDELKFSSSLSMVLRAQQQPNFDSAQKLHSSQLSQIVLAGNIFENGVAKNNFTNRKDEALPKTSASSSLTNENNEIMQQSLLQISSANKATASSQYFCNRHKTELLKYFCRTCCVLICNDCVTADHQSGLHEVERPQDIWQKPSEILVHSIVTELRGKIGEIVSVVSNSDCNMSRIKMQYQKAYNEINETYQFFCSMLEERKQEVLKELESLYNAKVSSNNVWTSKSKDLIEKAIHTCDSIEHSLKAQNLSDILMLKKTIENQHQVSLRDLQVPFELEFVSNYQSIQVGVRNTFGYIRATSEETSTIQKQPPIARPNHSSLSPNLVNNDLSSVCLSTNVLERSFSSPSSNGLLGHNCNTASSSGFESNLISKRLHSNTYTTFMSDVAVSINPYEKWSNGGTDSLFNGLSEQYAIQLTNSNNTIGNNCTNLTNTNLNNLTASTGSDSIMGLSSKILSASVYPPKSQIKRQKMIYHCKFGEFGVMEGQFTEPSGVAVNAQNDIIVADTNNHRIQIFDKEGRFKFQFGECGKRDSQLLYPNRVAVVKTSGDIIVTERSPTHQIQIYNQYGQFVRKFGANILQHPRGVTVDNKGRIIVVECKVMRVIIFDQNGNVIQKFGCSKHLEFPNGVVVNDKQEIFISDNRAHCVKVFNYEGQYLRQIGGEGVTNYPIGVGINSNGEILIADNHNNFNLTIFTQDGQLLSALESKVKHAQCFDVALMDDGSVVLASKDYRLYIYRYVQVPPIGL